LVTRLSSSYPEDFKLLTQLQKDEYRKNKGKICPYCKAKSIRTSSKVSELKIINQDRAIQEMLCKKCKKHWKEIYPFFTIEEVEEKQNDKESIHK
jgi:uncharacterized protein with PIN domain